MRAMIWNPDNLVEYAKDHSIKARKEQSNNKRNLHIIEHKGETKTLTEWSKTLNIPISTLYRYLASEKSLEKAIDKFQRRKICVVS